MNLSRLSPVVCVPKDTHNLQDVFSNYINRGAVVNWVNSGNFAEFSLKQVIWVDETDLLVADLNAVTKDLVISVAKVAGVNETEASFGTPGDEIVDVAADEQLEELRFALARQPQNVGMAALLLR